jgi:RecA-family ATPase
MNPGKLENSADAEKLMQKLRRLCHDTGVTLICIHHTPKMYDSTISMDSIKGSSVFSQESDFAIAVTQTNDKKRYVKEVFFRYAADDNENVKEFTINSSTWLDFLQDINEKQLLLGKDRRRRDDTREKIVEYFDQNTCSSFKTEDLVYHFTSTLKLQKRQIQEYLSELAKGNKIKSPSRGHYVSVKCENGKEDEKEKK